MRRGRREFLSREDAIKVWGLLIWLLFAVTPAPAHAQRAEPFGSLEVSASGTRDVRRTFLHDYWEPANGFGGRVSTPFYFGRAELGGALHRFEARRETVPRFDALLVYSGWGVPLRPVEPLEVYGGFRLGTYRMSFDEDTFPGVKNESEFTVGLHGQVRLLLSEAVAAHASATYWNTYTNIRMRLVFVSFGLSYTFRTPTWLRTFLR